MPGNYGPLDDAHVFELYPDIQLSRDNIEHYRGLAQGRLLINRCHDCHHWIYPHRPMCPECWSWNVKPEEISGQGHIFMFTLLYQLRDPKSMIHEPVPVAAVELMEQKGLRYLSRIVDCAPEDITHDMPVRLTWLEEGDHLWPAFAPMPGSTG
ncbi:MAG: zinc ribbon domain-containing protein [Novosphingobium sp.]|nr:zinc ribbon domain-containing protein [Novosphingobium sp.]